MQRMLQSGGDEVNYKKYDKLIRDIQRDSVDTDILDEELKRLQETEPKTSIPSGYRLMMGRISFIPGELQTLEREEKRCRGRTARLIESSPLHVTICILILLDVAIVTTEILMDMHATRSQYREATEDLLEATAYLRTTHPDVLANYPGDSVRYMLDAIRTTSSGPPRTDPDSATHPDNVTCATESILRIVDSVLFRFDGHGLSSPDVTSGGSNETSGGSCAVDCSRWFLDALRLLLEGSEGLSGGGPDRIPKRANESGKLRRNLSAAAAPREDLDRRSKGFLSDTKLIKKTSHILHYIGIVIVGLFAFQVFVKMYALGIDFFRQKMEVFDGIITLTSFAVDVVTLEGVSATQSEETIAVLVVFLLWRVLRLANALLVAAKQRQEFRIKLQKRGRQRSDKKIEWLETEISCKKREIDLLVRLCLDKGATDEEVNACRPKNNFLKLDASAGLSSVASFSLGLSMSMRGASSSSRPRNAAIRPRRMTTVASGARKRSFQELFPIRPTASSSHSHSHPHSHSHQRSLEPPSNPVGGGGGNSRRERGSHSASWSASGGDRKASEKAALYRAVTGYAEGKRRGDGGELDGDWDVFCAGDAPAIENEALLPSSGALVPERGARSETDLASGYPGKGSFDPERRSSVAVVSATDAATDTVPYGSSVAAVIDVCYQNSVCSPVSDFSVDIADAASAEDDNCIGNNNNSNGCCDVVVSGADKNNSNLALQKTGKYWSFLRLHVIK